MNGNKIQLKAAPFTVRNCSVNITVKRHHVSIEITEVNLSGQSIK